MPLRYDITNARATLTIDDAERRNPLSNDTMAALADGVAAAMADPGVRVIVLTGAGDSAFSAGGDLSGGFVDAPLGEHAARGALADLFRAVRRGPKPVVARVNGHALGGGFGLVAASDIAIATDEATLGMPEIRVGLWPMMITAVLVPIVPHKALLEMMMTGRRVSAQEAMQLGVISRVVPNGELNAAVDETVEQLTAVSPAVLALGKQAFYAALDMDFDTALDHLHIGLTAAATTEDAQEGIAAFLAKRRPVWRAK